MQKYKKLKTSLHIFNFQVLKFAQCNASERDTFCKQCNARKYDASNAMFYSASNTV